MAIEIITTVVTPATATPPANPYDLTDVETVRQELSVADSDKTNDAFFQRAITQASAAIATYCNRVFAAETVSDLVYLSGRPTSPRYLGTPLGKPAPIQLARWPIISVASVIETAADGTNTTLVQDTDFKLDAKPGWIFRLDSSDTTSGILPRNWFASFVTVQYQAGYATIPFDLVDATLRLVTMRVKARGRDPMLRTEGEPGAGQQGYWVGTLPGQSGVFPPEIEALVDPYRVPVAA